MTILYQPHTVNTIKEVNALALTDKQTNGTYVIHDGMICYWSLPYAVRNEREGTWIHEDGYLYDGDEVTVLVPIEAEEETSVVVKTSGFPDPERHPYAEASMDSDGNVWFGDGLNRVDVTEQFNEWAKQHTRTRLVTPWKTA